MASVAAIKNIPPIFPSPDFESILLARPAGKPISKCPKNDNAKNTNTAKKIRFSQTLVEILLNISGLIALSGNMKRKRDQYIDQENKKAIQHCIGNPFSFIL